MARRLRNFVESDGYMRDRNHGRPRRGTPPRDVNDRVDLRCSISEMQAAHVLIERAGNDALPRIERRDLYRDALAKIALAARFLDDVVDRGLPSEFRDTPKSTRPKES